MKTFLLTTVVVVLTILFSTFNVCQAQNPYGEVSFIKVNPGMNESFLIDMKTSKKLNNGLKAGKTINSWQLYRRVYPRGSSTDYDYATLQVFATGKEMQSRKDWVPWDAPLKELNANEIFGFVSSLGNVRTIVATDLYTYKMGVGSSLKTGEYVSLSLVNANPGSNDAYEKLLESLKPVIEEAIKSGKLKGWNVWKRTFETNIGGVSDYTSSFSFSTMDEALSWASGKTDLSAEYKKVYPKDDYNMFRTKLISLRELVSQELWELVDITD